MKSILLWSVWKLAMKLNPGAHFRNDFSIEIQIPWKLHSALIHCSKVIAMKFCTWHNSSTVVASAKFCSYMILYNGVMLKTIFHWILITMEKSSMKRATGMPDAGRIPDVHVMSILWPNLWVYLIGYGHHSLISFEKHERQMRKVANYR